MKKNFIYVAVLTLIFGFSSIFTAFNWADEPDIIIIGELPTEFTVMQNDYPISVNVSDKGYSLKNIKTGETEKVLTIRIPSQQKLGTYNVKVGARGQYPIDEAFFKEYDATVTVVPIDPKITISAPKLIKPDNIWPNDFVFQKDLSKYQIYAYNTIGNLIVGNCKGKLRSYWGYNKIDTIFVPSNHKYSETPFSFIVFNKASVNISVLPYNIFIPVNAYMNKNTLQARINGGKWRSIKETNKLKLKPNTKYKVEIRQKAESFHKAVILQTSYVKTKKSY